MKKKYIIICAIVILLIGIVSIFVFQNSHTYTLSNDTGRTKSEEIQPLFSIVKVSGDSDTNVVFTDVETGEKYEIGYITHGISETVKLKIGKWYTVEGNGNLTISPINVRIE